ncbi:hypothetical protein VPH35_008524 [Triticum aestivum]
MASPARAWLRPGTCRSLWLPPLRRGEITPKATGRRGVEGRRVSRSLERRGGRGRPRRRSVSEPCLLLQQGRRGSQTGGTRRGICVDDARVCVILSAGSAMDDYWRKPKMDVTNLHANILKDQ